ncbi:hypothetical protein M3J09_009526 [Ascochyta lentis]
MTISRPIVLLVSTPLGHDLKRLKTDFCEMVGMRATCNHVRVDLTFWPPSQCRLARLDPLHPVHQHLKLETRAHLKALTIAV